MKALIKEKISATHDKLTGLLSRETMESKFDEASKTINTFAVIMLDVDKFKTVNDRYGHNNGDQILKDLSEAIKSNIRSTDFAFRYGGDEFTILCLKTTATAAQNVAERIRTTFNAKEYDFNGEKCHFSISLGITECKYGEYMSFQEILKKADTALYKSKENGRDAISIHI